MAAAGLERLLAVAPGFGRCQRCTYLQAGSVELCYECASRNLEALAEPDERCGICDQRYATGTSTCGNPVCRMDETERWFEWNYAVAMRSSWLKTAINDYKYHARRAWAAIFGRILVGFLDANEDLFRDIELDLIVASPAHTGPGSKRSWDHIREILRAADREQSSAEPWPFDADDPPAIIKTTPTTPMVDLGAAAKRRAYAQSELRGALAVPSPARTRGRTIVVFDDVFTGGWTLNEVARALRLAGDARAVYGVTLSRQPYGGG